MALLQVNYLSNCLKKNVTMNVILPVDKIKYNKKNGENKPRKTLYLLHGLFGNYTDWLQNTRIQRLAEKRNLVVVMPSGDNSFYIDGELANHNYGKFIGEELVEITRKMFLLSDKKEDTFIAGLSMGGFGAIRNGLKYHDTFGYIAGLSSALHIFERKEEVYPSLIGEEQVFGNLHEAYDTDKNPRILIEYLVRNCEKKEYPKIYMACGLDDSLLESNRLFKQVLYENHFDVTYVESNGKHDWDFWNIYIEKVLEWLPLDEVDEGIHSGNVRGE